MILRIFFTIFLILVSQSCTKNNQPIYEPAEKIDPFEVYQEGLEAFNRNDYFNTFYLSSSYIFFHPFILIMWYKWTQLEPK